MTDQSHPADDILKRRSLDKKHCFLCGTKLGKKNSSREHIFPKFLLHASNLWDQKLTLLNGMTVPYRRVVIPCCRSCNNEHIGRLDKKVAEYVKAGYKKFRKIKEPILFQWLSRILYCILYLELITPREPRFKRRKILKRDFFRRLETVFLFLNSIRVGTTFHQPYPWSIFIFKAQTSADRKLNFDFKDNPLALAIALRVNDIGIVGVLQDNGAVKMLEEKSLGIHSARKVHLHPVQFSEVAAKIFYAASLINRVPKYMNIASSDGTMNIVSLPLGGLSGKPIFEPWNMEHYARVMSWACQIPYEQLYFPGNGMITFLQDEKGVAKHIPIDES
jgi:hypothetical protein